VLDGVRAEAARGREPILVLPTRADVDYYRRELAEGGLVLGVRLERFRGLVEEIARRAGSGGRPLGALARERLAAAVAAGTTLTTLGEAALTPGFARALADLVAELEGRRVTPARLHAAMSAWATADAGRAGYADDVARLFAAHRRAAERLGRTSVERVGAEALDVLRREPARWRGTPVLFYGFDDLTPLQLDAIETLAGVVDAPATVSLAYEAGRLAFAGRATTFQTLAPGAAEHVALAPRAAHYAPAARAALHHLERSLFEPGATRAEPGASVRLLEGGGERAELELVAGEIRGLLAAGMPAGEIAVVLRSPAAAAPLLTEVFRAAAIPFSLERRLPFSHTALGHGLIALLRCALTEASTEDLLAYLRAPGVVRSADLVDRLEARARATGAASVAAARRLWEQDNWPLERVDRIAVAAARGPAELLRRVEAEIEVLFAAPWRRRAPRLTTVELDDGRALAAGRRALAEMAELASVPGLAPDGVSLIAALGALELVSGDPPHPDAVAVVDPLALRARRVRALFLAGLQEGAFPAAARAEPFLGDEERRALAQASGLVLAREDDPLGPERYLLYATVSRPEELLFLSWHTADDDGTAVSPSLFVDDVCDLFDPGLRDSRARRPLGAVSWAGPGAPTAAAAAREQALRAPRPPAPAIAGLGAAGRAAVVGDDPVWSASSLELWAGCPVRWFVERGLGVKDLEPEAEPLSRGTLTHAVLETTLAALERETGSARLSADRLPLARRLLEQAIEEHAAEISLSTQPERLPGARRRLEVDLERYLEHACRAAGPLAPRHLEASFGFDEAPALDLGAGVRIRGRIDRVDVGPGEQAVVYDYKGRRVAKPAEWLSDAKFQIAIYMRAAAQVLGLDVVGGFYQPLGSEDLRARGVLAEEAGIELECVNGDVRPRAELEELVGAALDAARQAAAEARAGALQARPDTCAWGGGCAYPSICRCET
jgi:ATP-dependent helicase/DNAse subunit B